MSTETFYVVAATLREKDGKEYPVYFHDGAFMDATKYPQQAKKFDLNVDPDEVVKYAQKAADHTAKNSLRNIVASTVRIVKVSIHIEEPDVKNDPKWRNAINNRAVRRLREQEIVSLGLEEDYVLSKMSLD